MAANDKYLYGGKPVEVQSAAGVRGVLIRTFGGDMTFRVYHDNGEFTDYDIRHDDLAVTIDADELAAFYKLDGGDVLDHSPGVLGLQKVQESSD